jgi:hypothetical protein
MEDVLSVLDTINYRHILCITWGIDPDKLPKKSKVSFLDFPLQQQPLNIRATYKVPDLVIVYNADLLDDATIEVIISMFDKKTKVLRIL